MFDQAEARFAALREGLILALAGFMLMMSLAAIGAGATEVRAATNGSPAQVVALDVTP